MHNGIALAQVLAGERHSPVVYFLRVGDRVKIGTTTGLKGRMDGLSYSLEYVMLVVPGGVEVEAIFHERFSSCRIHDDREWFTFRGHLRDYLEEATGAPKRPWFTRAIHPRQRRRPIVSFPPLPPEEKLLTLRDACTAGVIPLDYEAAKKARQRTRTLTPSGRSGNAEAYTEAALTEWYARHYGSDSAASGA